MDEKKPQPIQYFTKKELTVFNTFDEADALRKQLLEKLMKSDPKAKVRVRRRKLKVFEVIEYKRVKEQLTPEA
jgi:hypothetical protein